MDNFVESNEAFAFKVEPAIIPATAIQRSGTSPDCAGGFGDIWKCYMSTQSEVRPVAVKSIRVFSKADVTLIAKRVRRVTYVCIHLLHDNILPLEGVTEGFGPLPAFVSPWMENGTLGDYLQRTVGLSWERKLSMVREVAAGLQYLHDKDIVHGNLTSSNVLVSSDGRLCLADYGDSMILTESGNATFNSYHGGAVRWMAPELVQPGEEEGSKPTKAGDVYSYGCVMMQVFSGRQPYAHTTSILAILRALQKERNPFPQLASISEEIQQFAQLCLSRNVEHRPSVGKIVEFLWSQTNIAETMKTMLSQLPVTVPQISQAVLTKCDYHPDSLDVLGETLKCKWVVRGSSEIEVTVKTLRDDVNSQNDINKIFNRIRREMYVREKLRHETILALYGITEGFGNLPSFVYPWMAGGSLHDYVKEYFNLSPRRKLDILLDVAQGIEYLHKQDVVHGNLTGDNVLLDGSGRVRITDFSHSVILAEADSRMFSEQLPGDVRYTAPESIPTGGRTGAPKPTKEGDVYSYGCIAILVLSGKVPYWWISEESQILSEKEMGTWPSRPALEVDEAHLNLVQQCLSMEKSRPSIGKVLYLVLVQSSGAADLTTLVERLNKTHQDVGSFGNVHTCKLYLRGTIQQVVFRYQSHSMSNCVDVAVKEINVTSADMLKFAKRLFREITIWLELKHENIVPLWGVADGFSSLPALISPWLKNGALTGYLEREHAVLSYGRRFSLLKNIARGLHYLHSRSIIHGDLSGNNVLVDKDGKASLTDFGLSALLPERRSQALVPTHPGGTPNYMAPECLMLDDEDNESSKIYPESDVYSFGGIMLHVLEGKVPYHYIRNRYVLMKTVSNGIKPKRPLAPGPVVEDNDWNFIESCWLEDTKCRPSDEDILKFVEGRARVQS